MVADIEYHSSGILKDLLKSSFSYFMGSSTAKPKPSDAAGNMALGRGRTLLIDVDNVINDA